MWKGKLDCTTSLYLKRTEILSLFSKASIRSLPQQIIQKPSFDPQYKLIQSMISQYVFKCTSTLLFQVCSFILISTDRKTNLHTYMQLF
jgi:hypothetical protein